MPVASILSEITDLLTTVVGDYGFYAVFLLMAVDAVLPAASEAVMVYGGAVAAGAFAGQSVVLFGWELEPGFPAYFAVASAGTVGYTVGSIGGWWIGLHGGRPFLERHGRWLHLKEANLVKAERWFERWEDWAVFLGRVTPVVRSFVSIPAGVFRAPLPPLHRPDAARLSDLVLRPGGGRLGARKQVGGLPSRLPLRRLRDHRLDRRRDRVHRLEALSPAGSPRGRSVDWRLVKIALVDVKAQYAPLIPQLKQAFADVLESGQFIFGPNVSAFEREAADFLDVPETIGVANGTDAIVIVLDALGVGRGDEVICPSFTFYATAESIARREATPVFVDIDPVTLNLDAADVERKITPRTKAILPVHLFGRPAPLAELTGLGVPIVEDAAQAFGSPDIAGTGIASTFSFYPTKNLFGLGDGGLVAVRDEELAERIRMLRFHGSKAKKTFEYIGYNSRLDEIQAAALRIFLRELDGWTAARREAAARYADLGLGELCEIPVDEPGHVYHLFVCRSPERDRIRAALTEAQIGNAEYYLPPLHLQPALRYLGYEEGALPETERAARENFSVPLWAGITAEQQERVVDVVRAAVGVASAR